MPPSTKPIEGKQALVVLDMQKVYVGKDHPEQFKFDEDILIKVNDEIAAADTVIYIRFLMKYNIFTMFAKVQIFDGKKPSELTEGLFTKGDVVLDTYKPGAFSNKKLIRYLIANDIDVIKLCGIDINNSIYQTALGAVENEVKVLISPKSVATMNEHKLKHQYKLLQAKGVHILEEK